MPKSGLVCNILPQSLNNRRKKKTQQSMQEPNDLETPTSMMSYETGH